MNPPKEIIDAGLNMYVDTVKLRELPLEIRELDIQELSWHFDMPVWDKDGTDDWNLTPNDVVKRVPGSEGHFQRIMQADTSHPILVTYYKNRWVIIDGVHRLAKLQIQGAEKIKAKIIPENILNEDEFKTV